MRALRHLRGWLPKSGSPGFGGLLGLAVGGALWLVAFLVPGPFQGLELAAQRFMLQRRGPEAPGPSEPPIVIVARDDPTYEWVAAARGQKPGAWSWQIYAELLSRLRQLGVAAVGFDFLFDTPNPGTAAFAEVLGRRRDTVLAALERTENRGAYRKSVVSRAVPALTRVAATGGINIPIDDDQRVRRYLLALGEGVGQPTLAVAMAKIAPGRRDGPAPGEGLDLDPSGAFPLDFRAPTPAFRVISMRDILDPREFYKLSFAEVLSPDIGNQQVVSGPLSRGRSRLAVRVDPPDTAVEVLAVPLQPGPWSRAEGRGELTLEGLGGGPHEVWVARRLGPGSFGVVAVTGADPGGDPVAVSFPEPVPGARGRLRDPEAGRELRFVSLGRAVDGGYYREVLAAQSAPDGSFSLPPSVGEDFHVAVDGVAAGTWARARAGTPVVAPPRPAAPGDETLAVRSGPAGGRALLIDRELPLPPYRPAIALAAHPDGAAVTVPRPAGEFRLLLETPEGRRGPALAELGTFRDARVLVGPTSPLDQDFQTSPFDHSLGVDQRRGVDRTPGVEFHAHALRNLLLDRALRTPTGVTAMDAGLTARRNRQLPLLGLLLALCGLTGVFVQWTMPRAGAAVLLGALVGYGMFAESRFAARSWWHVATPMIGIGATYLAVLWVNYVTAEAQRRQIRETFQHYLDPDIVRELEANPDALALGGDQQEVTCLFSDIEGFSSFSERMTPPELVDFINEYLTAMSDVLLRYGGWLDKFIGDAIVAVFNAPRTQPDHPVRCVMAALDMKRREDELRAEWAARGLPEVRTRIGINTGMAVVGNVGTGNRKNYTILGDAVNLAARLEALNKSYGSYLMIGEATHARVAGHFDLRELDLVRVKGKTVPAAVYQVWDKKGEAGAAFDAAAGPWDAGVKAYRNQRWDDAEAQFKRVLEHLPGDASAEMYMNRIERLRSAPPPGDWDGVWTMEHK